MDKYCEESILNERRNRIKLIIDVDKDYYEMLKYNVEHGQDYKPFEIIANGKPYGDKERGKGLTEYNELRDGQEFYGNGYKQGYADAELKYNKGEKIMTDKIKQAVADEFKYRASQGRTQYSVEELLYIVNEVIDEVTFEKTGVVSPEKTLNSPRTKIQIRDLDLRIRIITGDLLYLSEKVNEVSSILEELKIKGDTENAE